MEELLVELTAMVDRASAAAWGTRAGYNAIIIDYLYHSLTCARHTFALREGTGVRHSAHRNHYSEKVSIQGRN